MAKIIDVQKQSVSEEVGIKSGDELIGFNGLKLIDILDYVYYDAEKNFVMNIRTKRGELIDFEIEKDMDETLGLTLDDSVELEPIRCKNKCVFCFVDQLPNGMRETMYVKDDDYRLSNVCGNYVTFTNVSDKEIARIIKLGLSPLYVSVHSANPDIKVKLVANPEGANLISKMTKLSNHGIKMHAQVVMCPDLNDKEELAYTIKTLAGIRGVLSVAVVPVGLTKHREGLYPLVPVSTQLAAQTIDLVEMLDKDIFTDKAIARAEGFCWCSDEFYIKAKRPLPSSKFYGDFCQIENGVGLVAQFFDELSERLDEIKPNQTKAEVTFITGESFCNSLEKATAMLSTKFPNIDIKIATILNDFFGHTITVAGLLTGADIIKQLSGKCCKNAIIPSNMLREFTDTFLDGVRVEELAQALNTKIHISQGGASLVDILGEI